LSNDWEISRKAEVESNFGMSCFIFSLILDETVTQS
jgi:hypothetical protein